MNRSKKMWMLLVTILIVVLSGCGSNSDKKEGFQEITAKEAKQMMEEIPEAIILDVRTEEEYEEKHIPGAVLIPNEIIKETPPDNLAMDDTILIYCRSGNRSKQAAEKLAKMGYQNIYEFGGINDWPYETETKQLAGSTSDVVETALTGEFQEFETYNLEGELVNQDILNGYDLTMINIWGTFCGPCIKEMPDLGEIAREYGDQGFQMIGIVVDVSNDATLKKAKEIVEKTEADYLHLLPSEDLGSIYLNSVTAIPETLFVDKSGKIINSTVGSKSKEEWIEIIDGMLETVKSE